MLRSNAMRRVCTLGLAACIGGLDVRAVDATGCPSGSDGNLLACFEGQVKACSPAGCQLGEGGRLDVTGAAGPNGVLAAVNGELTYFTKSGSVQWSASLLSFFVDDGQMHFDPRVVYDKESGRFYLAQLGQGVLELAVSTDSDPSASDWYKHRISASHTNEDGTFDPDFTMLAVDAYAVHFSTWIATLSVSFPKLFVFDKATLNSGGLEVQVFNLNIPSPAGASSVPVAFMDQSGDTAYYAVLAGPTPNTTVRLLAVTNLSTTPSLVATQKTITVPTYGLGQPLSTFCGSRNKYGASIGNGWATKGSLWLCHSSSSGTPSARWYRISPNGWPETPSANPILEESGTIVDGSGAWTFLPSLAANARGDLCIAYLRWASGSPWSIRYVTRSETASSFGAPLTLRNGDACATVGGDYAIGDYSTAAVDPADQTFWIANEFQKTTTSWATYWGNVCTPNSVVTASREGFATPDGSGAKLHFRFETTVDASKFEVQYKEGLAHTWITIACPQPSATCLFLGNRTYEATAAWPACDNTIIQWRARAATCAAGAWSAYSPNHSFGVDCMRKPSPVVATPRVTAAVQDDGTVRFRIAPPATDGVRIVVFDVAGREVATLGDGASTSSADLVWDGRDARGTRRANAVYTYRATVGSQTFSGKFALVR